MEADDQLLSSSPDLNKKRLTERMRHTEDLIIIDFLAAKEEQEDITVCYLRGLADETKLRELELSICDRTSSSLQRMLSSKGKLHKIAEAATELALGRTVLLFHNQQIGIAYDTLDVQLRNVEEPVSEASVKGSRSGFTESFRNNLALIRYHCPSPDLMVEYRSTGIITKLGLAVVSIGGVTNPSLLKEVHRRLDEIPGDLVPGDNTIEEWIVDNQGTLLPLIESTERPDRVVGGLLEGRIAIVVQGSPFVMMMPFVFLQAFQVSEDYAWNYYIGSSIRIMRLLCAVIGMLLPGFYVATVTFHHELVPTPLLQSIASAKEPVPFPAVVESFSMMIAFEIMREAGVRMPKQVGQAVSIVGALILGQAAVQAGIVSPIMVIVAALTGIATFTLPSTAINYVIRMIQFGITLLASLMGYVGIVAGVIMLMTYLSSLRSFGVPYLSPAAPFDFELLGDIAIRRPSTFNNKRPSLFHPLRRLRYRNGAKK
ncbi:spore germination protein [Paenibacillus sp. YIM B09110]|uniref:spore germination protein n=1 Tax=Paenibacillus sp. YIM B09110 TaxID=3126102 RepID=UPI00301E1312